jgi:streptomycin 6-kinase
MALAIPANLRDSADRDDSPDRREWINTLPTVVSDLAERWSLRLGEPFEPGGQCSWVAPARDEVDRDVVLKVGWRHTEAMHEADALDLWDGNGAVLLFAARVLDQTSALLLERCVPGTMLNQLPEPEQDVVVAGLLRRLWCEPPAGHPFRSLRQMCEEWADEFDEKLAEPTNVAESALDPGLIRTGLELFRSLPITADREVVLCTDLHAENILAAEREPWLVIDPKPYVGDPTYDALQHMLNCSDRLYADPVSLVCRLADLLELDNDRLCLWAFARCVQESIDNPGLGDVARLLTPA